MNKFLISITALLIFFAMMSAGEVFAERQTAILKNTTTMTCNVTGRYMDNHGTLHNMESFIGASTTFQVPDSKYYWVVFSGYCHDPIKGYYWFKTCANGSQTTDYNGGNCPKYTRSSTYTVTQSGTTWNLQLTSTP